MFFDGATEVNVFDGYLLQEDETGQLIWHKILTNLLHPNSPRIGDTHRTVCNKIISSVVHEHCLGHARCSKCNL